jgi:hypothetical protein
VGGQPRSTIVVPNGAATARRLRVGLVDHAYHQHTRSTAFFKDEVLAGHEVEEWWDDRWHSGAFPDAGEIAAREYDFLVVLQAEELALSLATLGARNIVFVPMWDGAHVLPDSYWKQLTGVRIVSFCHALHERVQALGLPSMYAQYFPDPAGLREVTDFSSLRGFFWQRRPEISWRQVALLSGATRFAQMHLHLAPDPGCESFDLPTPAETAMWNITTSTWLETRRDFQALLEAANVFFAPREREGIGFSFLEAMAAGMCVVAPDSPTMNEYITDGVSGHLWTVARPHSLDFSHAEEMGARARQAVVLGRERWQADLPDLRDFMVAEWRDLDTNQFDARRFIQRGSGALARRNFARSDSTVRRERASSAEWQGEDDSLAAASGGLRLEARIKFDDDPLLPLVTVVCVTLNCADEFVGTISSILAQDYGKLEVIVIDGGSSDGTIERIEEYEEWIDLWVSESDDGPYYAMSKGAAYAHGRYVLFMNAGDWFVGESAIAQALRFAPADADFIYGHHIYRTLEGVEELHKANNFESTWRRLQEGDLDGSWLGGVPGHQATFTRTALLRRSGGYDTSLSIVADHDFLYRQRAHGARFHHCDLVVAVYVGGGYSWQNLATCFEEWREVASRYGPVDAAETFFEWLKAGGSLPSSRLHEGANERGHLRRLARRGLTSLFHAVPGHEALLRRGIEGRIKRSGLFFPRWYLETYPDVAATGVDPVLHYVRHGAAEGRNPSPFFETDFYLATNPEVRSAGLNPLDHYLRFGAPQGRVPSRWLGGLLHPPPKWQTDRGIAADVGEWLGKGSVDEIIASWPKHLDGP